MFHECTSENDFETHFARDNIPQRSCIHLVSYILRNRKTEYRYMNIHKCCLSNPFPRRMISVTNDDTYRYGYALLSLIDVSLYMYLSLRRFDYVEVIPDGH